MITIYGMSGCHYCDKAKNLAMMLELDYEYKLLNTIENKKEFFSRATNRQAVPQVYWDGEMIVGYKDFADKVNEWIELYKEQYDD